MLWNPECQCYEAAFNSSLIDACLPRADGSIEAGDSGVLADGDGNSYRAVAPDFGKFSPAISR
jgi:hypothetical protein